MKPTVGFETIEQCDLYMPSTPLNMLVSCIVALQRAKLGCYSESQMWLIDQSSLDSNYAVALQDWPHSPFSQIKVFLGAGKRGTKRQHRQKLFVDLKRALDAYSGLIPNWVAVGSDRRIEFQYVMHLLSTIKSRMPHSVEGVYLDDGLYTYSGRPAHWFKDGVNSLIKKMVYGAWYVEPSTVGASPWITQARLFLPEKAVPALQEKVLSRLEASWFKEPEIISLGQVLASQAGFELSYLGHVNFVVLIAHPNSVKKMPGYVNRIKIFLSDVVGSGNSVAIKYHPRFDTWDAFGVEDEAVVVIPSQLAFEFCLPALSDDCCVIGDVGTALLTTRWLRDDLQVFSVLAKQDYFQKQFIALNQTFGVKVVETMNEILK